MAYQLATEQDPALIDAGKAVFTATPSVLHSTSVALIGAFAVMVFFSLADYLCSCEARS